MIELYTGSAAMNWPIDSPEGLLDGLPSQMLSAMATTPPLPVIMGDIIASRRCL